MSVKVEYIGANPFATESYPVVKPAVLLTQAYVGPLPRINEEVELAGAYWRVHNVVHCFGTPLPEDRLIKIYLEFHRAL